MFENLSLGMLLVFLVLIFFLGNLRTAIIAAINIPLAMFGAFILLYLFRDTCKSPFSRCGGLRHHHRLDRHSYREHLSPPDHGHFGERG